MTTIEQRHVPIFTYITLLRSRKTPIGFIGFIFMAVGLFIFLPVGILVSSETTASYENYDTEAITAHGTITDAVVTFTEEVTNVTVNNQHPLKIAYTYTDAGKTVQDTFQTLDRNKADLLSVGTPVKIKVYKGQSQPVGMEPFSFPFVIFLVFPGIFAILGVIFFLIGFLPAHRIFKLYQNGLVRHATVYSMLIEHGRGRNVRQYLVINYRYSGAGGRQLSGTSTTTDLSLMQHMRQDDDIKIFVSETDETISTIVPHKLAVKQGWRI